MSAIFKFSGRVFYWILSFFLLFVCSFVGFQYRREHLYKVEILNTRLQDFNVSLAQALAKGVAPADFIEDHGLENIRVTILDATGIPSYDSEVGDVALMSDHSERREVEQALSEGSGYDIKRTSETLGKPYFYAASMFENAEGERFVVRSSLPYDLTLLRILSADNGFLWFALILTVVLMSLCYVYVRKLGRNVEQLRIFSEKAERNEDLSGVSFGFADSDLGEISQNIVRLYTQLQNSEDDKARLKRQLTQNIAHELKTPVSSIHAYLETITEDPDMDEATKASFLQRCYAQSTRLSNLLQDISLLTRMDEAVTSFESTPVNVHDLVDGIMLDVALQLEEKHMVMLNLTASNVVVSGDQALLYSIFRNLTDNSIAYAGDGSTITVRHLGDEPAVFHDDASNGGYASAPSATSVASRGDGMLCRFVFADNGVGVPAKHLPLLFERFYRVDKGRSRKLGGTGLGLAIVKNAILLHGGTIQASISPDTGGLEFSFTLKKA